MSNFSSKYKPFNEDRENNDVGTSEICGDSKNIGFLKESLLFFNRLH